MDILDDILGNSGEDTPHGEAEGCIKGNESSEVNIASNEVSVEKESIERSSNVDDKATDSAQDFDDTNCNEDSVDVERENNNDQIGNDVHDLNDKEQATRKRERSSSRDRKTDNTGTCRFILENEYCWYYFMLGLMDTDRKSKTIKDQDDVKDQRTTPRIRADGMFDITNMTYDEYVQRYLKC